MRWAPMQSTILSLAILRDENLLHLSRIELFCGHWRLEFRRLIDAKIRRCCEFDCLTNPPVSERPTHQVAVGAKPVLRPSRISKSVGELKREPATHLGSRPFEALSLIWNIAT